MVFEVNVGSGSIGRNHNSMPSGFALPKPHFYLSLDVLAKQRASRSLPVTGL